VPEYSLTRPAESDLKSIIRYTMKTWGRAQTKRYSQGLRECFQMLANNPSIGRKCEFIRPGLHRFEHGKHVVFYLVESDEIFIVRLQHQQMIPNKPQFE